MWMVHLVRRRITSLLTVRWLKTDKNWLRTAENSLGGFIPQARVLDIAAWFQKKWMVHLKHIQISGRSAKTRHEKNTTPLRCTLTKCLCLSFWKNTKNAKKWKRVILTFKLSPLRSRCIPCRRPYHTFSGQNPIKTAKVIQEKPFLLLKVTKAIGRSKTKIFSIVLDRPKGIVGG